MSVNIKLLDYTRPVIVYRVTIAAHSNIFKKIKTGLSAQESVDFSNESTFKQHRQAVPLNRSDTQSTLLQIYVTNIDS